MKIRFYCLQVEKVLFEHSHTYQFIHRLWLLLYCSSRVEHLLLYQPQSLKQYLLCSYCIVRNISSLCLRFLAQSFKNLWNFPRDKSLNDVNALTLVGPQIASEWGQQITRKIKPMNQKVGTFSFQETQRPSSVFWSMIQSVVLHNGIPRKTLDTKAWHYFLVGKHTEVCPQRKGMAAPYSFPDLSLCGSLLVKL